MPAISLLTDGLAVTGLLVGGAVGTTSMTVNLPYEPNIRTGETAIQIHPNISVAGLAPGKAYRILRYIGTASLPPEAPFVAPEASHAVTADAQGRATWADGAQAFFPFHSRALRFAPRAAAPPFMSDEAVYHFTTAAAQG